MKYYALALATLLASGSAFAADNEKPPVVHDKDGFVVHLDVAKVLSDTNTSNSCGVVPARLDYLNHQGQEHVLDYKVVGGGCAGG